MGSIVGRFVMPHDPALLERSNPMTAKVDGTLGALESIAEEIASLAPDVVVIISPHGPVFRNMVYIPDAPRLSGTLRRRMLPGGKTYRYENAVDLARAIAEKARKRNCIAGPMSAKALRKHGYEPGLDYGALVPLRFISESGASFKVVQLGALAGYADEQYRFGMALRDAIEQSPHKVAIVASAEFSHHHPDKPRETASLPHRADSLICKALSSGDSMMILSMDPDLQQAAGQSGLDPIVMLLGTLDRKPYRARSLLYENSTGTGLVTASIGECDGKAPAVLGPYLESVAAAAKERRQHEGELASLAREAIRTYATSGKVIAQTPRTLSERFLQQSAGTFVTLRMRGRARGMAGTILPSKDCIASEVIANAIAAANNDIHHRPVTAAEIDDLAIAVDIVKEVEKVSNFSDIDYERHGLRVVPKMLKGDGVVLPGTPGVESNEDLLVLALRRAGTTPKLAYKAWSFTTEHFE